MTLAEATEWWARARYLRRRLMASDLPTIDRPNSEEHRAANDDEEPDDVDAA